MYGMWIDVRDVKKTLDKGHVSFKPRLRCNHGIKGEDWSGWTRKTTW